MATQFMPPAYFGAQPHQVPNNGYSPDKNGPFSFRKRVERVDWRKIASVDVDNIARTMDFSTLQGNIMNITFCNLEAEMDIRSVDPNFVKLFKLAQLTIEYLLHSQEYLAGLCFSQEEKVKDSEKGNDKMKQDLEALQKELAEVKKESHKRKKMLIAQQQLMYAGNESYNKCPFCAKAFLNNSYLQSHITRRHVSGKENLPAVSPDLGMGSDSGHNPLEAEVSQIKERLLKQEEELKEERRALQSLKNKDPRLIQINENASNDNKENENSVGMSSAIMKEMKELNAKYQASQKALKELESRSGGKRSYLGDLEDDVDNEKELLKEQRSEVAALKEQLQDQLNQMSEHMQQKLTRQEKKWQKKVHQMTQQHASEMKKLNDVLENTSRSLEGSLIPHQQRQQQEVQEVLKSEVKLLQSPSRGQRQGYVPPRKNTSNGLSPKEAIRHSSMYPSDEDETAGFGTGTSSLRTLDKNTGQFSTLGQTGTQSLHASQFLEELRKNPTLAVMRDELAALLQEQVEKKGIPPNGRMSTVRKQFQNCRNRITQNRYCCECTNNQARISHLPENNNVQCKHGKYLNFHALRDHFNKLATEKAKKQLRLQKGSPRWQPPPAGPRRRLDMSPHTPQSQHRPTGGAPHPQQHLTPGRSTIKSQSPQPHPRAKTPLSTGSTTEWTSTQFDSDDDYSDDDEPSAGGKAFVPSPGARLIQSGPIQGAPSPSRQGAPSPSPRTQGPKPRIIQSRPKTYNGDGNIDDLLESEGEDKGVPSPSARLSSPKRSTTGSGVSSLRNTIEGKLNSRSPATRPVGGVDLSGQRGSSNVGNLDDESDWDDTTAPDEPAPQRRPIRVSTDGFSTNTYGTSAWGSSGKAASTLKDKERRSTSRSSFASITDVSSDEEMNVDNI